MALSTARMQRLALDALFATGMHHLMAPYTQGLGSVLMFHQVRPGPVPDYAPNAHLQITPQFLAKVVNRIRDGGIDIVDLDEALRRVRLGEGNGRRFCVITFDDGYRDNLEHAYPVLKALDCPFTVYVATGLIDRTAELWWTTVERVIEQQTSVALAMDGPVTCYPTRTVAEKDAVCNLLIDWLVGIDEDRQRAVVNELAWRYGVDPRAIVDEEMMDWEEVKRLASDPLVTIGAHTVNHHALAKLPLERARQEVRNGARVLEAALGVMPRHFAYPYGYASTAGEREFHMLADLGFDTAVTTRKGVLSAAAAAMPTAWPRISVNGRFQALRYLDLFLSGAPFALLERAQRLRPGEPAVMPVTASASTR